MNRIDNVINLLPIGFVLDMPNYKDENLYVCLFGDLLQVSGGVSTADVQRTILSLIYDNYNKATSRRKVYTISGLEFEGI